MYFVPNIKPTIPAVGGTVANHKKPKVIQNNTVIIGLGGKNINKTITSPLMKYIKLRINFFGNFVEKYPLVSVPKILNNPIIDNNVAAHQPGKPLSFK